MLRLSVLTWAAAAAVALATVSPAAAQSPAPDIGGLRAAVLRAAAAAPQVDVPDTTITAEEEAALELAVPSHPDWDLTHGSYVAIGAARMPGAVAHSDRAYGATGVEIRGVHFAGHGAYLRLEQADTLWRPSDADFAPDRFVLALDAGYAFGGPLSGAWQEGLLGFVEVGFTSWHASSHSTNDERMGALVASDVDGLGLAVGAALEARLGELDLGVAVHRRDVPMILGPHDGWASSTTLQLRVGGVI